MELHSLKYEQDERLMRCFGNLDKAKSEVEFAHKKVRYFKDSLNLNNEFSNSAGLNSVPISDKSVYRKNFPAGILSEGSSLKDPYVSRLQSSGTSGERLVSVIHSFKLAERMANCLSINPAFQYLSKVPRIKTCRYAAPNCSDVECANPRSTMQDRILADGTLVLPVYHDLLTTPDSMLRMAFDELHSYEPDLWYVDPMHLSILIKKAKSEGWAFDLDRKFSVLLTYTFATRALLRQISELCAGHAPVASVMAMSEFGFVGLGCEHGNLHLNDKDYFLEFIQMEGTHPDDNLWELVITSIGDRLCPHIRYQTNDIYHLHGACDCGNSMPRVSFLGRSKDLLRLPSGKYITPGSLDEVVGAPKWIDIYQLTEQEVGAYIFRFTGNKDCFSDAEKSQLRQKLQALLETENVRVDDVNYFPFERGGKFQLIRKS
ncbi:phenylacetate-CoA ligase [Thalassolituus maritimus]|uniref:Phenylacetate-CoA ligase n=1 Tax=Thalassolituus maritimus TaxID=484498 RepID=A0A1N7Q929_9GAMM|nr:hypothetical protein [Thalassolituus maritimus]SIT19360.1 phenylacetate-CoA ligase [Thalassolituus maritimus]